MCKKLYKAPYIIFYIAWFFLPAICFANAAQQTQSPPIVVVPQANKSQNQLTQIKALFDQADYIHLSDAYNTVPSLMLNEP